MLQDVLNRSLYDFCNETVENIQLVRSHEIEILQLTDLIIGAIGYANRQLSSSAGKLEIIETVKMLSGRNLVYSTSPNETKFNLFVWKPRGGFKIETSCTDIPELILFTDYNGDYFEYENAVYQLFIRDFIDSKPVFRGQNLGLKRHPLFKDREATFWHILTEGPIEETRNPDLRRYERILWPKTIIEYCDTTCRRIKVWKNDRKGEKRILLWCEDIEYLVVLAERKDYILFWTAYPVTDGHTKRKLKKEYDDYIKKLA